MFGGLLPDDFPPTRGVARALWWRRPERVRAPALQSGAAKLVEPDAVVDTQTSILDPKAGWHDFRLDLARVLYITLWLTLGLTTLRKGHTALFWFGIIFPVL